MLDIDLELEKILDENCILKNEIMANHTSFKIGGTADYFLKIENIEKLKKVLNICKEKNIPYFIIGNGTNLLVKDEGFHGAIIKLEFENIDIFNQEENSNQLLNSCNENNEVCISVGAGVSLAKLANIALENNLSGLEFASGIPGTIGGAIYMNAGAFGGEMKDVVVKTKCLNADGDVVEFSNDEQKFGYRTSMFKSNKYIILETLIKLKKSNFEEIKNKMDEFKNRRLTTQPVGLPNAGSIFKRNEKISTAKMIDECGLKGFSIGDAEVSTKHAGFIVNKGNAKAEDVLKVIEHIRKEIKDKFNEDIELEILIIGG